MAKPCPGEIIRKTSVRSEEATGNTFDPLIEIRTPNNKVWIKIRIHARWGSSVITRNNDGSLTRDAHSRCYFLINCVKHH